MKTTRYTARSSTVLTNCAPHATDSLSSRPGGLSCSLPDGPNGRIGALQGGRDYVDFMLSCYIIHMIP
jgi:hypothetical protein